MNLQIMKLYKFKVLILALIVIISSIYNFFIQIFSTKKTPTEVEVKNVKSRFLLYKNDFKFQLGFKVVVKKGTNKIKSSLQTIDFEHDTINFKIKK